MDNEIINNTGSTPIDRHAFDFEYSTQFKKEMLFLKERGFNPIFIKKTKDYRIPTYKYTKTPELFRAVAEFYEAYRNEKLYKKIEKVNAAATEVPGWVKDAVNPESKKVFGVV